MGHPPMVGERRAVELTQGSNWTIGKCLTWTTQYFTQKRLDNPRLEAEVLLGKALGQTRVQLYMNLEQPLQGLELARYRVLIKQRAEGMPTAYLVGEKEFMSLAFEVNRQVLIPRPDTEVLVETSLELIGGRQNEELVVVDVGTGSGNIAVALAHYWPKARVIGIDISEKALEVAKRNAGRHEVADRVTFYEGDLLSSLEGLKLKGKVDLIAANLPYIPSNELPHLMREVLQEPISALDGGRDGLSYYRRLLPQALDYLKPGGYLIIEIGPNQGKAAQKLFKEEPWDKVQVKLDYGGRERVVCACSAKPPALPNLRRLKVERYRRAREKPTSS